NAARAASRRPALPRSAGSSPLEWRANALSTNSTRPSSCFMAKIEPIPADSRSLRESPFLRACRREPTDVTPVWFMRQAGRYMPEYREVRAKVQFLDLCKDPALATEVTVTAAARLGVDAAILFADILLILEPMGFDLEFARGEGPVIHNPVRSSS